MYVKVILAKTLKCGIKTGSRMQSNMAIKNTLNEHIWLNQLSLGSVLRNIYGFASYDWRPVSGYIVIEITYHKIHSSMAIKKTLIE